MNNLKKDYQICWYFDFAVSYHSSYMHFTCLNPPYFRKKMFNTISIHVHSYKALQQTWGSITKVAQDRQRCRKFFAVLHTPGCKWQRWHSYITTYVLTSNIAVNHAMIVVHWSDVSNSCIKNIEKYYSVWYWNIIIITTYIILYSYVHVC